jgi:hypothetical protein
MVVPPNHLFIIINHPAIGVPLFVVPPYQMVTLGATEETKQLDHDL